MYHWYTREGYSVSKVAAMLNDRGYKTKRGCQWTQNAICRISTNPLYTGKIINGKQEVTDFLTGRRAGKDESQWMVVDRPDLQIIDPDTFRQAQEIMEAREKALRWTRSGSADIYLRIFGDLGLDVKESFYKREASMASSIFYPICHTCFGKAAPPPSAGQLYIHSVGSTLAVARIGADAFPFPALLSTFSRACYI